jgi:PKD repeat protein
MKRRIFSISLVLGFLLIALLLLTKTGAQAQASTPTPMPTSPAEFIGAPLTSASAPLTVQFTHIGNNGPVGYCAWEFGDGTQEIFNALQQTTIFPACPSVSHTYSVPGTYSPLLTALANNGHPSASKMNPAYVQVGGPMPTATIVNNPVPDLKVSGLVYFVSNPLCPDNPQFQLNIRNYGGATTTTFQVTFNGETRTVVNGIDQGVSLTFTGPSDTKTVVVDTTNAIAESNESNNSVVFTVPASTCGGSSPTATRTPTPTTGPSATPSRTPTAGGPTATRTPTQPVGGACSPVTSTITIPFTFDGAGTFCWQASSLGGFVNSWNTTSVSVNGVNVTNVWVGSGSYPAKINGFYYVSYSSSVTFGHFEAKP